MTQSVAEPWAVFVPDRATYISTHWIMAAVAMAGGMAILWVIGNPHVWSGAIGGLAAVVLRGWYLMDEELGHRWNLTETALEGPQGRRIPLDDLEKVRILGAAVQLVTRAGDKHLIKFQANPASVVATIDAARGA